MTDSTKTIVITGASSGIGKATARLFAKSGWNVVAAMRRPGAEKELIEGERLKLVPIGVWLNNAGYGAFGPVEAGSRAQIQCQFDVNVQGSERSE